MPSDGPFRFSTALDVRWRDVDALGHVNNAVYFTYLEQARVYYLRELGLIRPVAEHIGFILAEASCRYISPLSLAERVTVHARVSRLGTSSFVFDYQLNGEDGRLVATARTVQVRYDRQARTPIPIPADWRQTILDYESALDSAPNTSTQERSL